MKKSLIALAVLGAYAGVASAQSSVKLDGTLDVGIQSVKNGSAAGGSQQRQMINNGINSSQFRVSGVEDMGGGLKAGFNLNSGVFPDTGRSSSENGGKFWNRRATVSLEGGFGEIRLGRDYTPNFWNMTLFDPFGTNGIGTLLSAVGGAGSNLGTNTTTAVRADNSIQYWTPALGGLVVHAMVSANENVAANSGNKYQGIRVGYSVGPLAVGGAIGNTTVAPVNGDDKLGQANFAISYKVGPAKLNFQLEQFKAGGGTRKETGTQLGAVITVGQGEIRAAFNKYNSKGPATNPAGLRDADDATHIALGYVYNLSTRTALYGTYSTLKNKGAATNTIGGLSAAGMLGGETSSGVEGGLRHFF